jgi:hypothetical protein
VRIKVSGIPADDLVGKSVKVMAIDGVENLDGDPATFTIPKANARKLLGIQLPRKYAIDTISLLLAIETDKGKMHVPVLIGVNRCSITVADEFMFLFGKPFMAFLRANGMKIKRIFHDTKRNDET